MKAITLQDSGSEIKGPVTDWTLPGKTFIWHQRIHALTLLRRRLQGLFGRSFQLEVRSEMGEGTTVTMRIPLRKQLGVGIESSGAITPDLRKLASH